MKEFLMNSVWSVLAFFAILLGISYLNNGYIAFKQTLTDPFNWLIIAIVIVGSYLLRMRRRNKGEEEG
ncbi:MAG: hypothetical protein U5K69_29275 [Balneolaceae bacterium]|nr:hypothetical protein [Balneolaceae bacterium]